MFILQHKGRERERGREGMSVGVYVWEKKVKEKQIQKKQIDFQQKVNK